jgi:PIN domain nuclease of toxin-antitoxin system
MERRTRDTRLILLDTNALLWSAMQDSRLGRDAAKLMADASVSGEVAISAISLWEIGLLVSKKRLNLGRDLGEWVKALQSSGTVVFLPVESGIALEAGTLPGDIHGDPADRIVTATARVHGLELMTSDEKLLAYGPGVGVNVIDARL